MTHGANLRNPARHRLRLRDDRDEAQALAEVAAELTAAGATVIERPDYNSPILRLDRLSTLGRC